jgi:hypothetical protein
MLALPALAPSRALKGGFGVHITHLKQMHLYTHVCHVCVQHCACVMEFYEGKIVRIIHHGNQIIYIHSKKNTQPQHSNTQERQARSHLVPTVLLASS